MKHEQAILVTVAYIIGFTTAFIAFALNSKDEKVKDFISVKDDVALSPDTEKSSAQGVEVFSNEEGLFMVKDGKERILSGLVSEAVAEDGYHLSVVSANVSPDGSYIHYCLDVGSEASGCVNFVYSVADDTVYKLKSDDSQLISNNDQLASVTWVNNNQLQFNGMNASQDTSWILR